MLFEATLNQIALLLLFIIIGYVFAKLRIIPDNTQVVLSKLENILFIPALVLGTFINNFTTEKIEAAWKLLLNCLILEIIIILLSVFLSQLCSKDRYEQSIYRYGLCFSNFGFMGNAVVSALFPEIFLEYLIYTLPLWTLIYLWAAPALLIGNENAKPTIKQRLRNLLNPMFVCMIIGMAIGLTQLPMPSFVAPAITAAGNCMSPLAMLLTGMTVAQFKLKDILAIKGVYIVTVQRLILLPLLFLAVLSLWPMEKTFATCTICALSMPLGLNTIIIPGAYGKDVRVASGMALVSHIVSCVTIPIIFTIFSQAVL